jgi:hypothetical protein
MSCATPSPLRIWAALFAGSLVAMAHPTSAFAAESEATPPAIVLGEAWTLPLAPAPGGAPDGVALRVVRAEGEELVLEFNLAGLQVQSVAADGEAFHLLAIEGGGMDGEDGQPMLPIFSRLIRIPDRAGVSWEVTALETRDVAGFRPFPLQPDGADRFVIDRAAYTGSGLAAPPTVQVGSPAIARDLRVVPIVFSPVRYDPARSTLEIAQRVEVRITFAGTDLRNARDGIARAVPNSFDRLYRDLVVNYPSEESERGPAAGEYLILCPDNADVIAALQPLVEWRTRRGFRVRLATTTETGTTREQIQSWLMNAFTTWQTPPEYVCLVGDADGTIAIPAWSYGGGDTDHQYSLLAGDDILADIIVGRISVDTVDRLRLYVTKIVGYESTPYMTDTSWYKRACVVGDPSSSGYSCVQIMQWIKSRLLDRGYAEVDTIFAAPWVSQMVAALNRGDTVFAYRGYYGTSSFNNGHISSLTNGWKMPFTPTLTCGTGSFAGGTAMSEAWIRAGVVPDRPTGAIASIGMSTLSTVTKYNNALMYGIWHAILVEDQFHFGQASVRGKYELFVNYGTGGSGPNHTHWCNLMGDPAGEIWTAIPQAVVVTHPASVPRGTNAIPVTVTAQGAPCAGAYVCLWKGDETFVGGLTDAGGTVELAVGTPTTGTMQITVTKHDHRPYLANIMVQDATEFVGYAAHTVDDDALGTSAGNGDGLVNPTERIELPVQVCNFGGGIAYGVTGTLTSDDPYVTLLDASETFGDVAAGGTAWSADDFDLEVDAGAPHGHVAQLGLDLRSGLSVWHSVIRIPIASAGLEYQSVTTYNVGGQFDPGETGELSIKLDNVGAVTAQALSGTLVSQSPWVTVTDAVGTYGDVPGGMSGENIADRFAIRAATECYPGHLAPLTIYLTFSGGARDTVRLTLPVGTAASDDPTGPDAYGYYAFDNTDVTYPLAPAYTWVEIDPNHGGSGVSLALTDFGVAQDDSKTLALPFPFIFYGQVFTQATICSNGWICMGSSYLTNWNNWNIPGAGAPPYLIAPMWDDLRQDGTNQVYQWFDSELHRYIVQWSRMINVNGGGDENFEVIFYDPAYYPTDTGDGEIVFQYETFENTDTAENYCTVGIENADQSTGVLYTYANQYTAGSPTIGSGRAIKFATYSVIPAGVLMGTIRNATDGGTPLAQAEVRLLENGRIMVSGADGVYGGSTRIGTYTAVASHPSFAPDTIPNVLILEGETTVIDFALVDILPPAFSGTTQLPNTGDAYGPYTVRTTVTEYSDLAELALIYNAAGAGWVNVPMVAAGGDDYTAAIPGQGYNALIQYYLVGEDVGGNAASDPPNAPEEVYEFWVLPPIFADDMEAGPGSWLHYALADTLEDQWHLSTLRNHTPGGADAWKFGDAGSGDYADLSGGVLESQAVQLSEGGVLTLWHWIEAEVSGAHPGYCYDGGLVEMSVDGGAWTQIAPVGGYPYRIRTGSVPGPFPAETPVFSGTVDWTGIRFDLGEVMGAVRFRFVFGSDGADVREGWYLDDLMLLPTGPGAEGANEAGAAPVRLALHPSAPNPFLGAGGGTLIRFDLPQAGRVQLQIVDASGRLIRPLLDRALAAGQHRLVWDGRDGQAHPLASGRYFCVLRAGGARRTREVLLVR